VDVSYRAPDIYGAAKSLSVPSWKAALEPAGWQVLNQTPGNTVARRGDWWAKIGLDRLTLVQRVEAEALQMTPPSEKIEELKPNQDVPYITPLLNTTRKAWKIEDPFELKGTKDPEPHMLGPASRLFLYLKFRRDTAQRTRWRWRTWERQPSRTSLLI